MTDAEIPEDVWDAAVAVQKSLNRLAVLGDNDEIRVIALGILADRSRRPSDEALSEPFGWVITSKLGNENFTRDAQVVKNCLDHVLDVTAVYAASQEASEARVAVHVRVRDKHWHDVTDANDSRSFTDLMQRLTHKVLGDTYTNGGG